MKSKRKWLAMIPALLLAAAVGHQLWARHRLFQGDASAARQVWFGRRAQILAVVRGAASPRARAVGVMMLVERGGSWSAEEFADLVRATEDPAPVVRVAALESLLHTTGSLTLEAGLGLLGAALEDDAPIPAEEIDYFLPLGRDWAHEGWELKAADPSAPFTPALYAAWWIGMFDSPPLAFAQVVDDGALRRELEAAAAPFDQAPAQAAARVAWARARVAAYQALLAERGEPEGTEFLNRLTQLVAGHPELDPERHFERLKAIEAKARAAERDE